MFEPSKVDLVTLTAEKDEVLLYIVASESWTGTDEQLLSLQHKIHNYVGYAVDGQMNRDYPETADLPWRIVVDSQSGLPDSRSAELIDRLADPVRQCGGELRMAP
jgi:hypothetical protein